MDDESWPLLIIKKEHSHIVGISPSLTKNDQLLVTVQNQGIFVYDVYERKCRKSWLIGSNAKFTHHTIEHPHPDLLHHFFAVQDGESTTSTPSISKDQQQQQQQQRPSIVCHWRVEESDLKNMIKKEFLQGPIHSIHCEKSMKELILVFMNGELVVVDVDLNEIASFTSHTFSFECENDNERKQNGEVVYADVSRIEKNIYLFVLMKYCLSLSSSTMSSTQKENSSQTFIFELRVFTLQRNSTTTTTITTPLSPMTLRLVSSYRFHSSKKNESVICSSFDIKTLTLALFWSGEKLSFYKFGTFERFIQERNEEPQNGDSFLTMTRSLHSFRLGTKNRPNRVHSLFWNGGVLVLVGQHLHDPNESLIVVWDTCQGVVLHSKSVNVRSILRKTKRTNRPHSTVENDVQQICKGQDNNFIGLCYRHSVFICPLSVSEPELATICGQIRLTKQHVKFSDPVWKGPPLILTNINLKETLNEMNKLKEKKRKRQHGRLKEREVMSEHVDDKKWKEIISKREEEEKMIIKQLNEMRYGRLSKEEFLQIFNDYVQRVNGKRIDVSNSSFQNQWNVVEDGFSEFNEKKYKSLDHWLSDNRHRQRSRTKHRREEIQKRVVPFSQVFIKEVCRLCLRGENACEYIFEPIETFLLMNQLSISSVVRELIPALIVARKFDLIVKVLLTIDDVIEFDLLLLLKFFISAVPLSELQQFWIEWEKTQTQSQTQSQQNEDTIQKKKTRKRNKYQKHETTTTTTTTTTNEMRDDIVTPELALDRFLNLIVTVPSNDVFVQQSLKSLNIHEVMVFLRYVMRWLTTYCDSLTITNVHKHIVIPSLSQLLKWTMMIIDSHISELILVDECSELVEEIEKVVKEHIHFCEEIQTLKGCLNYYFNTFVFSQPQPQQQQQQNIPDYSLEIIDF